MFSHAEIELIVIPSIILLASKKQKYVKLGAKCASTEGMIINKRKLAVTQIMFCPTCKNELYVTVLFVLRFI